MLEALKIFLTKIDFSLDEIPNQNDQINSIHESNLQNSRFSKQDILNCFLDSYKLVKKHVDIPCQSFDQFEQGFKKDFEDYFSKVVNLLHNKELTYVLLTQLYQSNVQKFGLQKLIDRYEGIAFDHYCFKQEYLSKLAAEYGQNDKLTSILDGQMNQLLLQQEKEREFLQKMREMKSYFDSEEFISQKFQLFNDNNIQKIDRSSIPVLPNFFINLNIADSLNEMNKVNFSNGKNDCGQQFIKTNKDIPNDEKYLLNTLKGIQDLQSTPYIPISIISNSRTKHEVIIQNILSSQREITTNFFDESNGKIYEGDIIGYLERRRLNSIDQKILILTTPGLDATPSLEKTKEEMRSFQNLKMYIKNYQNIEGDDKGYSKQLTQGPSEQEEKTQLFTIFQLMKKSIVCYYLIHQSNTIYVVLQDNEQDFALYKQIELICSNFLVSEGAKKEINFIHYYPSISDVKSKHAEIQFETIKSKYNLKDTASDFKNECFMKFEQQEDRGSSNYRKKMNKQIQFQHIMLFGDFESRYNQQLFEQIRKDIDNTRCDKIVPNQIETNFRIHIFQYLAYFFQTCDEKQQSEQNQFFQFKERQINEVEDNFPMDDTFQEWKDLIFYPYSFLTPNSIKQHKLF